jgi:hypothetical protein
LSNGSAPGFRGVGSVPAIVVFLSVGGASRYPRIDRHTSALRLVLKFRMAASVDLGRKADPTGVGREG